MQELFNQIYVGKYNKYVFHVNIHIFVLKYLVQKQIIQNQFKISEVGKWNRHQMLCVYSSRKVIKAQPMCKFAQLYACHELFLKYETGATCSASEAQSTLSNI